MSEARREAYERCLMKILNVCGGESDQVALMASVVGVLKNEFSDFYWVGFYRLIAGELVIGPYQGTVGCLRIELNRGVCGAAARTGVAQIVPDVHQFPGHIACDPRSQSEIVLPVRNREGVLIAVLDIDSTQRGAFSGLDRKHLEEILGRIFGS